MKQGKPIMRVISVFTVAYIVAITIAILYLSNVIENVVFDRLGNNVKNMAILVADGLDLTDTAVEELKALSFAELPEHEANKQLASFFDLYNISENIRFAYLSLWFRDEQSGYYVTEQTAEYFGAEPGTPLNAMWLLDVVLSDDVFDEYEDGNYYDEIHRYSIVWEEQMPLFESREPFFAFFDDEFGMAIVGMAPVYTVEGNYVGMLGIDYYYDYYVSIINGIKMIAIFILIMPAIIITLVNYLVTRRTVNTTVERMEEQRRLEAAELANRTKDKFLAHISHEIRTPMNSIIGFSELAMDDELSEKTRRYFDEILKSSEWLLQIINDLLDTSKFEFDSVNLENIPFDLQDVFTSCNILISPKAEEKGLKLNFNIEPLMGKRLYGDPLRLRQVFANLLLNAVKFTNTGFIEMSASVKETTENDITMAFEVKDTGIGITDEQLKTIFDPFTQVESGIVKEYGGSGLGLSITKKIVEMMGGTLSAKSTIGVGSNFSFELTFKAEDITEEVAQAEQIIFSNNEKPIFQGEVLVCEDNKINQIITGEQLARVGLKAVIAENGKIGVDMVENRKTGGEKQFDLIFMDINMPVMDGITATTEILQLDTGVPIIAVTANIMREDVERYYKTGMNDCLGKPFTSLELWRCLVKYIKPVSWQHEQTG